MKLLSLSIALGTALAANVYAQQEQNSYTVKSEPLSQIVHLDGVVQPVN
jgi:hypothetical protein